MKIGRRHFLNWAGVGIGWVGLLLGGCAAKNQTPAAKPAPPQTLKLSSPAFSADGLIPAKHTCKGENLSPALSWDEPPAGTQSLVLLVTDPDAPGKTFVHWVLYDLPPTARELPEGMQPDPILAQGGVQGKSDFGKYGYGGPCPPQGTHRYVFTLYALDTVLDLPPGAKQADVLKAIEGHTLAQAELVGRYGRVEQGE